MKDDEIPAAAYQPWRPMSNPQDIKTLGKLAEELGECQAAAMRCLIQGIEEHEPKTGYLNRLWLEDEIADVLANIELVVARFDLDKRRMEKRYAAKMPLLHAWHTEASNPSLAELRDAAMDNWLRRTPKLALSTILDEALQLAYDAGRAASTDS